MVAGEVGSSTFPGDLVRRLLPALLFLTAPTALSAQWRAALLHGTAASHGDAQSDNDPAHPQLQAHQPATWTLSLLRASGDWRIGLELRHITADLAEIGAASSVTTNNVLAAWGAAVEVGRRVVGGVGRPSLVAAIGVTFDRWTFDLVNDAPRTRAAGRAALEADFPIGRSWSVVIRGEMSAGPSLFNAGELPDGFSTRTATRQGIGLGVARWF